MTPWVRNLLFTNVAVFFLTMNQPGLLNRLAFRGGLMLQEPWTILTYQFAHAGMGHIFFNMLSLWIFGSRLEARLGGPRFVGLYLFSGFVAAIVSFIATPFAPIVGASGAIFGIMLGYARYWPKDTFLVWGIVPVQARWMVLIMTGMELFMGGAGIQSGVAHFAHLGGFVGAFIYIWIIERTSPAARFKAMASGPRPAATTVNVDRWKTIRTDTMHPVNRQEVERLLEKLSGPGVTSLTPDERAFLDRMSA